jgi:hypothetical protein
LEDMLRASILHFDKSWDRCLSLAEFSYNNSYQASLKMAPFDALYGRRCRTPLNWSEAGERTLFGPDIVKDAEEKVQVIRENLKMAQMRQKSYHDKGTAPRHFEVGDYVYLKVSPTKGVQRFGVKGKLAPRYIGPYEVIEECGPVAVSGLDRQTYQGSTRGSRLCGGDHDRETENSKVCARTRDTRFIQVRVAKVANPTSCLGDPVWRPTLGVG